MNTFLDLVESPSYNLKNIYRYSNCKLINHESTAEHTILMQLLAIEIYNKLHDEFFHEFDLKDLCFRILLHDLDETVMCDIPRDIKYFSEEVHEQIELIADAKLKETGYNQELVDQIKEAKHNSVEGELAGFIDVLQAVIKIREEYLIQRSASLKQRYYESVDNLQSKYADFKLINSDKTPMLDCYLREIIRDTLEQQRSDLNG